MPALPTTVGCRGLVWKFGALYFAIVLVGGFIPGTSRVLWLVPHVGERIAELLNMLPLKMAVSILAAQFLVRRLHLPSVAGVRLGMGSIAVALLLCAEFSLVRWLRRLSLAEYFATRDAVSGTVYYFYYLSLLIFASIPLFVARR